MNERLQRALDHLPERMQDEVAEIIERIIGEDERDWEDVPFSEGQAEIRRDKRLWGNMVEAKIVRSNHCGDDERLAAAEVERLAE